MNCPIQGLNTWLSDFFLSIILFIFPYLQHFLILGLLLGNKSM